MTETNPEGVNTSLKHSDATADAATHLLQSGILDRVMDFDDEESPNGPVETQESVQEDEPEQATSEESDEDNPDVEDEESTDEADKEIEQEIEEVEEPVYTVKINGKEAPVTLDELKNGYQRQSDYTQKTQELSQARKAMESDYQAMAQERQQYQRGLYQFNQILAEREAQFEQIDWNELAEVDLAQYMIKKEEQRELRDQQQRVEQENFCIQQLQQHEAQKRHSELLKNEWQQLENSFPEWKDPDKRAKLSSNWEEYAVTQGYSPDDVKAISDHRALKILNKAMLYDKIQKASVKKGKIVKVPKTAKPGVATDARGKEASGRLKNKMKHLKQTGSVDAAASVFFDMEL